MEASDLLLAGDDSSWNMSDWQWDSVGFVAVPKLAQQSTSSCCKKRRTSNFLASERQPRPCGGCKYFEHGPLKLLQQASDSAGSNSCGDGADCKQQVTVPAASPAAKSSTAGHRPVTALHASSESTCQADGCRCDMSKQSVWHQKSRICDKHMSGMFLKQGKHQQFCQQCGRSHNPDAFDQGRRSCRTQLAKHAARRRKRSTATSTIDTPGPDFPSQVAGTAAATGCRAAVSIAALAMRDTSPDAWFQTLCDSQKAAEDQSLAQPHDARHRHSSGGSEQSLAKHNLFSQQTQPVSLEDIDSAPLYQLPMLPMHTNSSEAFTDGLASNCPQPISTSTWAGDNTAAPAHQVSDDPLQDLLSWQLPSLQESKPDLSSFDKAMSFMQNGTNTCDSASDYAPYQQQQQPDVQAEPVQPAPGCDAAPLLSWNAASVPYGLAGHTEFSSQTAAPASYSNLPQQAYSASTSAVRLSIKLFNCTPAQLPGSLRERVTGWLGSTPAGLEGYIRPGCVHLTVQATMPTRQAEGAVTSTATDVSIRNAVNHLLASPKQEVWHRCTMLVQLGSEAAVVHEGNPLKVWNIQGQAQAEQRHQHQQHEEQQQQQQQHSQGRGCGKTQRASCCGGPASLPNKLPVLSHAQAVCLVAGQRQQQQVTVFGHGLSADCKVLCRAGGNHLEVQMLRSTVTSEETADMLQVALPGEVPAGLLYLEVQRGSFMGPALPVLVAPTLALAAEAAHMLRMTRPSDRQGLIVDLGCAMQYTAASQLLRSSSAAPAVSGMSVVQTLLALMARAAQSGLDALVRHFMSVLAHDDMRAVATFRVQSGMGLLHLGVQSGKLAVLAALLEESDAELWQDGLDGPGGISPFHLAVFLPEAQSVALLLSATLGASHWFCCTTHDGLTPADFAVRCSKDHLNHAVGAFMWSQASAGKSLSQSDREVDIKQQLFEPCVKQASADGQQPSGSTSSWSDSSSSAEDDSGSDVDASQHGGDRLSAMPAASFAMSQGLSAAAKFVQEKRERLAAVLRQVSWFQNPNAQRTF